MHPITAILSVAVHNLFLRISVNGFFNLGPQLGIEEDFFFLAGKINYT